MFGWQEAAGEGFEDVAADSWYCGAVMTAQANGALGHGKRIFQTGGKYNKGRNGRYARKGAWL